MEDAKVFNQIADPLLETSHIVAGNGLGARLELVLHLSTPCSLYNA